MTARTAFFLLGIAALVAFSAGGSIARTFGIGHLGLGKGKLGAAGSQGSNGTPPTSACTNGNLLLVYSDPCQLMSQMVGN
jgi:hypothetical protein